MKYNVSINKFPAKSAPYFGRHAVATSYIRNVHDSVYFCVKLEGDPFWTLIPSDANKDEEIPAIGPFYNLAEALKYQIVAARIGK